MRIAQTKKLYFKVIRHLKLLAGQFESRKYLGMVCGFREFKDNGKFYHVESMHGISFFRPDQLPLALWIGVYRFWVV